MSDKVFLDTNIFIYLYSEDEQDKRTVVSYTVNNNSCITSTQALNEACNVWYRKCNWDKTQVKTCLDGIEAVCDEVMLVQRKTINSAISIKDIYGYSYYDSLILASALEANCDIILTEDMSDGQIIENRLTIINPFSSDK